MRTNISILFLFLSLSIFAQHTFSIAAVDPETGEVGCAGATCLSDSDCNGCGGAIIISGLLPGRAAMNSQAYVCLPNINLNLGLEQLEAGMTPAETLQYILDNDACSAGNNTFRQYGIAALDEAMNASAVGYTGTSADDYKDHLVGENYSVQGNILIGPEVLEGMQNNFLNTEGPLCDRLMAALQGANIPGADERCLDEGVSSRSAFIRIAKPDDVDGNFWLDLNVPEVPTGTEPIDSLQSMFDIWKEANVIDNVTEVADNQLVAAISPNPIEELLNLNVETTLRLEALTFSLVDIHGKILLEQQLNAAQTTLNCSSLPKNQIYFAQIRHQELGKIWVKKVLVL